MLFLKPSGIFWNVQCVLVRSSPICTACTCTRRCTPQHQVKDGAGYFGMYSAYSYAHHQFVRRVLVRVDVLHSTKLRMARGEILMLFSNPISSLNFFGKSVQTHIRTAYCTYDATACTCTRRCTPQHQGGNSDVIFESNFEFDFFWEISTNSHTYSILYV